MVGKISINWCLLSFSIFNEGKGSAESESLNAVKFMKDSKIFGVTKSVRHIDSPLQ